MVSGPPIPPAEPCDGAPHAPDCTHVAETSDAVVPPISNALAKEILLVSESGCRTIVPDSVLCAPHRRSHARLLSDPQPSPARALGPIR
jgi:hypothetical protein